MKKTIFVFLITILYLTTKSQNFAWAKTFGNNGNDYGSSIATDNLGNIYTTGIFLGSINFGQGAGGALLTSSPGNYAIFVLKQDSLGNFIWAKQLGNVSGDDKPPTLSVDANLNVYIAGTFNGSGDFDPGVGTYTMQSNGSIDIFVTKLDPTGNFLWAKKIGGNSNDFCRGLTLDNSGMVYLTGSFKGICDFDPGVATYTLSGIPANNGSIFIEKLDATGNFVWAKNITPNGFIEANAIAVANSGNVYIAGSFDSNTDFDPGAVSFSLSAVSANDVFILKLNSTGDFVWAKSMGGNGPDNAYSITLDANENIYTTGRNFQVSDFDPGPATYSITAGSIFISKLDVGGNFVKALAVGSNTNDAEGRAIRLDNAGNCYVTGYANATSDFDPGPGIFNLYQEGMFILKLDANLNFVWANNIVGTNRTIAYGIAPDNFGNVYVTGGFEGTCDFDPGFNTTYTMGPSNYQDIFILKQHSRLVTGIREMRNSSQHSLEIYPNPNNGVFTIKSDVETMVDVINSAGQLIIQTRVLKDTENRVMLENLSPGIYFVIGKGEYSGLSKKLVVVR